MTDWERNEAYTCVSVLRAILGWHEGTLDSDDWPHIVSLISNYYANKYQE